MCDERAFADHDEFVRQSGALTRRVLEEDCQLLTQRLALLHGFSAAEIADKSVFAGFVANLLAIPWITLVVTPLALAGVLWAPLWSAAAAAEDNRADLAPGLLALHPCSNCEAAGRCRHCGDE